MIELCFQESFVINATWQETDANLGDAGMRMWSSVSRPLLPRHLSSMRVSSVDVISRFVSVLKAPLTGVTDHNVFNHIG
jgi:hypothetical protein